MMLAMSLPCALLATGVLAPQPRAGSQTLWVECEQFAERGGWLLETQFIDTMGSAYLLAQGLHGPTADARTTVRLPAAGTWHLWVRTKNWVPNLDPAPGRFTVRVGSHETPPLGDGPDDRWHWRGGGAFELPAGDVELALHDLTGEYGRCDVIVLTTDAEFAPAPGPQAYEQLRLALSGVDATYRDQGEWDVVVVGGGLAGTVAAIAAARHGARTLLVQDRSVLGGNASEEIRVGVAGATNNKARFAREAGLVEEGWREAARLGSWSKGLAWLVAQEPLLTVRYNLRVNGVTMRDAGALAAVQGKDVLTGQGFRFRGRQFIDCTGDAAVGAAAGAELRVGREARSEHDESIAPEVADRQTLGTSLLYNTQDTGAPAPYTPPRWAYTFATCDSLEQRNHSKVGGGYWWIEYGNRIDTIADAEHIRDQLLRILYGVWGHVKTTCQHADEARNLALKWVGTIGGKRESRRLMGDYLLVQQDVQSGRLFDDRVAYGGWPIDLHVDIFTPGPPYISIPIPLYSIPYRSLYSRNIRNLQMAGRNISVSHVALGTVRVMATCATEGQAVGTAAAMCIQYGQSPREIGQQRIAELQQRLLRDDCHLLEMPLEEPDNLARQAKVTASSEVATRPYTRESASTNGLHPLDGHDRAVMLPSPGRHLSSAWALVQNRGDRPTPLRMLLRAAKALGTFEKSENLGVATAEARPGRHWVEFKFDREVGDAPAIWFVLEKAPQMDWLLAASAPVGFCRAWSSPGVDEWRPSSEVYALVTEPSAAAIAGCSAAAVTDGWSRPRVTTYGGWSSDPARPLPQWLEARWDQPTTVGRVELVFDPNLDPKHVARLVEPEMVKDYELQVEVEGQWRTVAAVKDNYRRLCRHTFAPVKATAVRLVVTATGGDPSARVFELRAYAR